MTAAFRRFALDRAVDESGVSGTGRVAYGVHWPDGSVSLNWSACNPVGELGGWSSFATLEEAIRVHGHGGATEFNFLPDDD